MAEVLAQDDNLRLVLVGDPDDDSPFILEFADGHDAVGHPRWTRSGNYAGSEVAGREILRLRARIAELEAIHSGSEPAEDADRQIVAADLVEPMPRVGDIVFGSVSGPAGWAPVIVSDVTDESGVAGLMIGTREPHTAWVRLSQHAVRLTDLGWMFPREWDEAS